MIYALLSKHIGPVTRPNQFPLNCASPALDCRNHRLNGAEAARRAGPKVNIRLYTPHPPAGCAASRTHTVAATARESAASPIIAPLNCDSNVQNFLAAGTRNHRGRARKRPLRPHEAGRLAHPRVLLHRKSQTSPPSPARSTRGPRRARIRAALQRPRRPDHHRHPRRPPRPRPPQGHRRRRRAPRSSQSNN